MIPQPIPSSARQALITKLRPAPLRGLNLSDPITALKEGDALRLDDWVCRSDGLHTRGGYTVVWGQYGAPVAALLSYPGQLLTCTATAIYDEGTPVQTGCLGGDWQGIVQANPGGQHLVCVNGADLPKTFGGWQWGEAGITGVNGRNLFALALHQRRVFLLERNTLNVWYLGIDAIGGPASVFPMHAQCRKGGHVAGIASLSGDGGRGPDDRICIVTSEGELIVYAGADPDFKASWQLVGVWNVPKPLGTRPFGQIGGSLALLTADGVIDIPRALASSEGGRPSLSERVDPLIGTKGRAIIDSGSAGVMLVDAGATQLVRSDQGWSRFTGFSDASCWAEHSGALYFGTSSGQLCRYGAEDDANVPIQSFAVDAFSPLGTGANKTMRRVRPHYKLAHPYVPRIEALTDYREPPASFAAANTDSRYWQWDEVTWLSQPLPWYRVNVSSRVHLWRSLSGRGRDVALMMSLQTKSPVIWTGYDVAFEAGGAL